MLKRLAAAPVLIAMPLMGAGAAALAAPAASVIVHVTADSADSGNSTGTNMYHHG